MAIVKTRFAPSPTGFLHIGGLRTAAYAYALSKSKGGKFILRIEDTDQKRLVPHATEKIYDILKKFNLNWDEGPQVGGPHAPYIQSERVASGIYQKAAEKLVAEGHAFYCFCKPKTKEELKENWQEKKIELRDPCRNLSPEEIKTHLDSGEKPAVRLKVPDNEKVSFYDFVIRKESVWNTNDVDDAMLLKSDGFPTYHLAVVIDDTAMEVTHVIRAMEWFSSTPIHVLVYRYLGLTMPSIGHPSSILDPDGGKLSKRKGNVSCEEFLQEGYLPEALLNFVILLGWAPKDNREMFTLADFVESFNENGFQKSNPVFNIQKLDWFNGQYIRQKSDEELADLFSGYAPVGADPALVKKITPLVKDRIKKLSDFKNIAGFFFNDPGVNHSLFGPNYQDHLKAAFSTLANLEEWQKESIDNSLVAKVKENNFKTGDFFMDLRIAVSGNKITPPFSESIIILGKDKTIQRVKNCLE